MLILTARDAVQDRITGLDSGADDYVVKSTDLDELAARLRALVRRSKGEPAPVLRVGQLVLDPAARMVTSDGQAMDLQPREFTLLQELMLNAGRVRNRRGAGLGCRSCSGSSICIEARSGSTRRRRPLDYRSRLLYRVLWMSAPDPCDRRFHVVL